MTQEYKEKPSKKEPESETTDEAKDLRDPELDESIESFLDEIDDVLEENAQDFVDGFVQKGGQ